MSAIPAQGGQLDCGSCVGIANRDTNNASTDVRNSVASYVCEHHLLHPDGYHNVGYKIPTDQSIRMYLYLYKFI